MYSSRARVSRFRPLRSAFTAISMLLSFWHLHDMFAEVLELDVTDMRPTQVGRPGEGIPAGTPTRWSAGTSARKSLSWKIARASSSSSSSLSTKVSARFRTRLSTRLWSRPLARVVSRLRAGSAEKPSATVPGSPLSRVSGYASGWKTGRSLTSSSPTS